ncbi:unnamed protein product [Urochloa humidicola]
MDAVVCGTCGSGRNRQLIEKCARCNASEHCYCMKVLPLNVPREWYCAECQEYADGCSNPSQGGQMELQKPWQGCDKMKDRKTGNSNVAHQINPRSLNKFGNAKVKYISSEEVALLNKEWPPYVRSRSAHPPSPLNRKHSFNLKRISPSRSDTQVQALKRCASSSTKQQKQVHPASPSRMKQLSNTKSISPSKSDMQVQALKRYAAPSRDQDKIEGMADFAQRQVHHVSPHNAREMKIVNADKGEINSEIEDGPRENKTLYASDGDTGSKSEMENLNQHRDVLISIDPSMEYTRRPPPESCWMGCFHVSDAGANLDLGSFKAQFPSKVSCKVYDIVKDIPKTLELELLPRMNDWPKSFETSGPVYEDIGLFFFPNEPDGHEKKHSYLSEASNNYVLRAHINGTSTKLLIYSSEVLPHDSQWIDGESYLWGVFVRLKGKSDPKQFGSSTT